MVKTRHRFLSILLILLTLFTCTSSLIPTAHATSGGGVGTGGGAAQGAEGVGMANSSNSGIRMYVLDNTGKRVSNIVDILNSAFAAKGASGWTCLINTRFEGLQQVSISDYGNSKGFTKYARDNLQYSVFFTDELAQISIENLPSDNGPITVTSNHSELAPAANSKDSKRGPDIKKYLEGKNQVLPMYGDLNSSQENNAMSLNDQSNPIKIPTQNELDEAVNSLIDVAYASGGQANFDPVYTDNQIQTIMIAACNDGNDVFKLSLPQVMNKDTGRLDIIKMLGSKGCTVCIEPIWYGRYQCYNGTTSSNMILGTPYNTYQFINAGGWTPDDAYNGNSSLATNNSIPWSMYLNRDLVINGNRLLESVPASDFKDKIDQAIEQENLQWAIGHSFMYFKFSGSTGTEIPTYDDEPPDGMKPNPKPHPAPNADPNYPTPESPRIPLVPGEDPTKTRTVNIVKTYVIEYLNGTEEHVATYTRTKVPQTIRMLQEPDYKLVGYITSPDYYFEKAGVSGAGVKETTWDTMMGAIDQQQSYRVMKYEDSKSRYNTGELVGEDIGWENPVKISEACKCESKDPYDGGHPKHWNKVI